MAYFAVAENSAVGRVRYQLLEVCTDEYGERRGEVFLGVRSGGDTF